MKTMIKTVVAGLAAAFALGGFANMQGLRIEDGKAVVDSPFDLKIGSTEYAEILGDRIRTSASANYDPETGITTTNYHGYANVELTQPYYGYNSVSLSFSGEEKALDSWHIYNWRSEGEKMSMSECREVVKKIAADIKERLDITLRRGFSRDFNEDEVAVELKRMADEHKREGRKVDSFATSFTTLLGSKEVDGVDVDISVSGMVDCNTNCHVSISYQKMSEWKRRWSNDGIPVHTNSTHSSMFGLVQTEEMKAAHEEAAKLRETIKRLFGVDLDTPSQTNELSGAAITEALLKTNDTCEVVREWTVMERPFEGMDEQKVNQQINFILIPFGTVSFRHAYEGDVTEDEMKAQAERFLAGFQREYGAEIPKNDEGEAEAILKRLAKLYGEGVPAFGDTKALLGLDKVQCFVGRVGDIGIEISYALPRYVKRGGEYELALKGAVVVNIVQSPILTRKESKE